MLELRLCSIEGARWLKSLDAQPPAAFINPPRRFGLATDTAIARRVKEFPTAGDFRTSPAEGLVLALTGVKFESEGLIVSAVHALGAAGVLCKVESEQAYAIEKFIMGMEPYSCVPRRLAAAGVFSCLCRDEALQFARWIKQVKPSVYGDEVAEMHGTYAVDRYMAVAEDLQGTFQSVSTHQSDLACWRLLERDGHSKQTV